MADITYLQNALENPGVRQFLDMLSAAEGTTTHGYNTAFGGGQLQSLADHPRQLHAFTQTDGKTNRTSAAGRYQFLQKTWDGLAKKYGFNDFGPQNQDLGAVALLAENGALDDILRGDMTSAVKKSGRTWASLPSSPYAQPTRSQGFIEKALNAVLPAANAGELKMPEPDLSGDPLYQMLIAAPGVKTGLPEVDLSGDPLYQMLIAPAQSAKGTVGTAVQQAQPEQPGMVESTLAGIGKGFGSTMLGAQQLVGQGVNKLMGPNSVGNWLVDDANQGLRNLENQLKPYSDANPISAGVGDFAGQVAVPLAGGFKAIKAGGQAGNAIAGALGAGNRLTSALNLGGRAAGAAGLGAAASSITPVSPDNPEFWGEKGNQLLSGAAVGAALPIAGAAAGKAGGAVRNSLMPKISTEVAQLAQKAKGYGIDLPVDRVMNSKPINALSASLDYVPFSGKGGRDEKLLKQFNSAISGTVGESTDNVAQALKNAHVNLGRQFDDALQKNVIKVSEPFIDDLARISQEAASQLETGQAKVIQNQIDEILMKVKADNTIDGRAAYNIKKVLDRMGKSPDTEKAYFADELRKTLLDGLSDSMPDGGQAFANLRKQYGNMLTLEKIVPNGAEGGISPARLSNMRNLNGELKDLADIASQFIKGRVGDSGTAQRASVYGLLGAGSYANPVAGAAAVAGGRAANMLLGSTGIANHAVNRALNGGTGTTTENMLTRFGRNSLPFGVVGGANLINSK